MFIYTFSEILFFYVDIFLSTETEKFVNVDEVIPSLPSMHNKGESVQITPKFSAFNVLFLNGSYCYFYFDNILISHIWKTCASSLSASSKTIYLKINE